MDEYFDLKSYRFIGDITSIILACTEKDSFKSHDDALLELANSLDGLFEYVYQFEDFTFYEIMHSEGKFKDYHIIQDFRPDLKQLQIYDQYYFLLPDDTNLKKPFGNNSIAEIISKHYSDLVNFNTLNVPTLSIKNPFYVIINTKDPVDVPIKIREQMYALLAIYTLGNLNLNEKHAYIEKAKTNWKGNLSMKDLSDMLGYSDKTIRDNIKNLPYWAESIIPDENHNRKYKIMIGRIDSLKKN